MRNNFKRFLGVAFVLIMALSVMTVGAFAAEETVAKIGDAEYATLAAAMTEANKVAGDYTITMLKDSAEVFTFAQKNGVNITIDGEGNTFTGKITLNAGAGNLTFTDATIVPANSQTIYLNASTAPNVTFDNCLLKGNNKSGTIVYGYASNTANAVVVKNCEASDLQYIVSYRQTGSKSLLIENVTATDMIYLIRPLKCPEVTVKDVTCDAVIGIDVKNDAKGKLTLENVNINIVKYNGNYYTPVNGSGAGVNYDIIVKGKNSFTKDGVAFEGTTWFLGNAGYVITVEAPLEVAAIGENQYKTLADAVAAAKAGQTITLLADVNENVTLSKNLTIDGDGYKYTGNILTSNTKANFVIKNVNFVDCDVYAIKSNGAYSMTVENCTATNCGYGFLYANKTTSTITVKNVEIDGASYGLRISYNTKTTLENVTMKNVNYGLESQTFAKREFNFKNCTIDAVKTPFNAVNKGANVQTLNFKGVNDFGIDVTTLESNLVKVNAAAQIGTKIYGDLKTAIADAKDGDVITLLADQTIADSDAFIESVYNEYYVFAEVTDKNITIDLNGKVITINPDLDKMLIAVIYSAKEGEVTLKDSSEAQTGAINVTASETSSVYSMFAADEGGKFNIENGNYYLNRVDLNARAPRSLIYTSDDMNFTVNGGNFVLGNARTSTDINGNPQPWIFNGYQNGHNHVYVTGGTYNAYPQNSWDEAKYPYCYDAIENEDGTWTVKYSPAVEIGETGYESLKEAVAAAKDGDVITVCKDQTLDNETAEIADYDMYSYITVSDKKITIDLNGKTITANPKFDKALYGVIVVNGTGDVTLTDNSTDKTGAINVTVAEGTQAYSMLSTDGATSKLTIESGNYYIDRVDKGYSMIYIAQTGTGYVNGGNFVLGNAKTMIRNGVAAPWIFNTVGNAKNVVYVNGGRYNTDPDHHWGEAKFKKGFVTVQAEDGMWDIVRGPVIVEQPTDITIGYNKMAKFAPVIKGEGLTYTWYYKDANATKFSTSSIKTATYDIQGTVARNGREIYCVAKDVTGKKVTTATVKLTVVPNEELEIVSQPTEVYGALDTTVSVKMDVKGDGLTYKWEFRNKGASTFQKSTIKTATYDLLLSKDRMDREVRCTITDAFGKQVVSDIITLKATCTTPLEIIEQPTYEAVALGKTVKIKMNVQGEYLTYKWYFCNAGSKTWTVSSIKDSEYDLVLSKDRIGRQVYCVITDAFGNSVQTETVTLYAAE